MPNTIDKTTKLCDSCHERPAVHQIRYEHTARVRHTCQVCVEHFPSPQEMAMRIDPFLLGQANANLRPAL